MKHQNVMFFDFGDSGMISHNFYNFIPFDNLEPDSTGLYNIDIIIRYTDKCQLQYLPLKIECSSFKLDSISQFNLSVALFNDDNKNEGKGRFGFYESVTPLKIDVPFDEGLNIAVSTVEKDTQGIISLGLNCFKDK